VVPGGSPLGLGVVHEVEHRGAKAGGNENVQCTLTYSMSQSEPVHIDMQDMLETHLCYSPRIGSSAMAGTGKMTRQLHRIEQVVHIQGESLFPSLGGFTTNVVSPYAARPTFTHTSLL
jgi:hypothetical protein